MIDQLKIAAMQVWQMEHGNHDGQDIVMNVCSLEDFAGISKQRQRCLKMAADAAAPTVVILPFPQGHPPISPASSNSKKKGEE